MHTRFPVLSQGPEQRQPQPPTQSAHPPSWTVLRLQPSSQSKLSRDHYSWTRDTTIIIISPPPRIRRMEHIRTIPLSLGCTAGDVPNLFVYPCLTAGDYYYQYYIWTGACQVYWIYIVSIRRVPDNSPNVARFPKIYAQQLFCPYLLNTEQGTTADVLGSKNTFLNGFHGNFGRAKVDKERTV